MIAAIRRSSPRAAARSPIPASRPTAVTAVTGGSKLKIVVNETILHPGHYRISLARRRNLLPLDPAVTMHDTERGLRSQSAFIMTTPITADHRRRSLAAH